MSWFIETVLSLSVGFEGRANVHRHLHLQLDWVEKCTLHKSIILTIKSLHDDNICIKISQISEQTLILKVFFQTQSSIRPNADSGYREKLPKAREDSQPAEPTISSP